MRILCGIKRNRKSTRELGEFRHFELNNTVLDGKVIKKNSTQHVIPDMSTYQLLQLLLPSLSSSSNK